MIEQAQIWDEVWPVVESLIQATLQEDDGAIRRLLVPGEQAAQLQRLFGFVVFDILLKTVLGRQSLGLTRVIETKNGRHLHLEYAWPDPDSSDRSYTAADITTIILKQHRGQWRVLAINPAAADLPLTEPRAQGILLTNREAEQEGALPNEPWILPVALYAGSLQLPLREVALKDAVEELLLPGLQKRQYGLLALLSGQRLWRDFKKKGSPTLTEPAAWAAAAEQVLSEQHMRQLSQAAAGQQYEVSVTAVTPRVNQIKQSLQINGLDERYTTFQAIRFLLDSQQQADDSTPS